jgi:hypothetical protein
MARTLIAIICLLSALAPIGCKSSKVDFKNAYKLGPGEMCLFRISGEGATTSLDNTGAAVLRVAGASTDGVLTWDRPNIAPGSKTYEMTTTREVDVEVWNVSSLPGAFRIKTVGDGQVVLLTNSGEAASPDTAP